jgi:phosphoglycerate dehydrogenase-like enzyme
MKILVTAELEEAGLAILRQYGEVIYEPLRQTHCLLAGDMLVEKLEGVSIFVTEADPVSADVLDRVPLLKVICVCRGDPVNVDIPAATQRGVLVLYTPGRNAHAVADLTVCLMIMLARHIPEITKLLYGRSADDNSMMFLLRVYQMLQGTELWDKTVGIIGFGAVGQMVAARVRAFEARIIAYDPYLSPDVFTQCDARQVDLPTLLRESDLVTLHAKVTPETQGMLGAEQFALMKPTAYFLNLARAAMTDEDALVQALREKRIAGAALDVFSAEPPPPDHPLLQLDVSSRVIALPHIGGNTAEVAVHQSRIVVPDIERILRGEQPQFCLNPEIWKGFRLDYN